MFHFEKKSEIKDSTIRMKRNYIKARTIQECFFYFSDGSSRRSEILQRRLNFCTRSFLHRQSDYATVSRIVQQINKLFINKTSADGSRPSKHLSRFSHFSS